MGYWIINGKQMTDAEYEEHRRQELEAKARLCSLRIEQAKI